MSNRELFAIVLIVLGVFGLTIWVASTAEAATPPLTALQGGTGLIGTAAGNILIGAGTGSSALRYATDAALVFSTSTKTLTVTNASTTDITIGTNCDMFTPSSGTGQWRCGGNSLQWTGASFIPVTDAARGLGASGNRWQWFNSVIASTTGTTTLATLVGAAGVGTSTPYAKLSVHLSSLDTFANVIVVASSTPTATTTLLALTRGGQLSTGETRLATSSTDVAATTTIDWFETANQVLIQIGVSNFGIAFNNASTSGMTKRVNVCNSNATAGLVTWADSGTKVLWPSQTIPVQTTAAGHCDVYSCIVSSATSSAAAPTTKVQCSQLPNY